MEADAKQTAEYLQAQMRAMAQQHALEEHFPPRVIGILGDLAERPTPRATPRA